MSDSVDLTFKKAWFQGELFDQKANNAVRTPTPDTGCAQHFLHHRKQTYFWESNKRHKAPSSQSSSQDVNPLHQST